MNCYLEEVEALIDFLSSVSELHTAINAED